MKYRKLVKEKHKQVTFYMTQEDYEALFELADRRGCINPNNNHPSVSELLRRLARNKYRLVKR